MGAPFFVLARAARENEKGGSHSRDVPLALPLFALLAAFAASSARPAQDPAPSPGGVPPLETPDARDPSRPPRVAVFRAEGFPTVDAPEIPAAILDEALAGLPVDTLASATALAKDLKLAKYDLLVLPHGSAFPLDAWPSIRKFLENGGGLVALGGAPLHQPVRWEADARDPGKGRWVPGPRQPTFAQALQIGPAEALAAGSREMRPVAASEWAGPAFPRATIAYALTIRLATVRDFPNEDGTAGPRDGVVRPLVHILGTDLVPFACPLLEIDWLRGPRAGARWVLAPSNARLDAPTIRAIVERALQGAIEVDARPVHAAARRSPDAGASEVVPLRIVVRRPFLRSGEEAPDRARVTWGAPMGPQEALVALTGPATARAGEISFAAPARDAERGRAALASVRIDVPGAAASPRGVETGIVWLDGAQVEGTPRVTVSRDWLRKDGAVFPVVGTTYMASDVHRKFLFEPNPLVWDRDFAEMARHGMNFVRTGIWTGWQRAMVDPGALDEGVLRALDAYVAIAAKHDIVVCFTFFAFLPPAHGGSNPYLDPRALEGQKALLSAVARRFRGNGWVHFDLINEPSYAPPEFLWQNRPIGDAWEKRAWTRWVLARHGADPLRLRDLWRDASEDPLALPSPEDLSHRPIREQRRPRKAADFTRFSNDVVARWAAELRETLRATAGDALVTLGQDEGGTWTRPAQQLHFDSVDYTSVHTWWNNGDLLWDSVVTKVPEAPNLHSETGLMRLEDLDGNPWRSPDDAAALLERKSAYAFLGRGAGVVQWAWNVNPYMPIDNESVIGLFRPDGTAKPELAVLRTFAAFFREAAPWLDDFEPDPVVVVLPHTRMFAGRPHGMDAVTRTVRVLAERFGVVPTALSDLRITAERLRAAKLVIVPCAEMLDGAASEALLAASRAGTRVLFTGVVEGDTYGEISPALAELGVAGAGRAVAVREPVGGGAWATFEGNRPEWLRRGDGPARTAAGERVWHEPLPLEFASEEEPLVALYGEALAASGVETHPTETRVAARVLLAPKAALVVCVNETPADAVREVSVDGHRMGIPVLAQRARLVLVERGTGRVIVATEGEAVRAP